MGTEFLQIQRRTTSSTPPPLRPARCLAAVLLWLACCSSLPAQNRYEPPPARGTGIPSVETRQREEPRTLTRSPHTVTQPSGKENAPRAAATSIWKTFAALTLVVGLILVSARLWKSRHPSAGLAIPTEALEIIGRKPLDQQTALYLIRCGKRILLVGSAGEGLRTLTEVTDPVEVDYLAGLCRSPATDDRENSSFLSLFQRGNRAQAAPLPEDLRDDPPRTTGRLSIPPAHSSAVPEGAAHD